jgi:hypothetical protein
MTHERKILSFGHFLGIGSYVNKFWSLTAQENEKEFDEIWQKERDAGESEKQYLNGMLVVEIVVFALILVLVRAPVYYLSFTLYCVVRD